MEQSNRILIVDDELNVRLLLSEVVRKAGYEAFQAENGLEGVEKCRLLQPSAVLMDLRMPVMEGMEAFDIIRSETPEIPVILLTAFGTVDIAVEAMRRGAFDYLVKPANVAEVRTVVERALTVKRQKKQQAAQMIERETGKNTATIVGRSAVMQNLFKTVGRVAQTNATVLITGESGSGKELIAKAIHTNSPRKDGPFIRVNCGAMPEGLMESEMFGHEKGSFTGAVTTKVGRFELADSGTLFLDEVGELTLPLQVKILRALQDKEFERVGGNPTLHVDVRIIAATNRNLEEMIEQGKFREDLYYRLNVVPIHVPPLRERTADIPFLIEHFVKLSAQAAGCPEPLITQEARDLLQRYSWPGNVRELANMLERTVIMSNGVIDMDDLPGIQNVVPVSSVSSGGQETLTVPFAGSLKEMSHALEREIIIRSLKKHGGNRMKTALALDISRRALLYKLEEYGLGANRDKESKDLA
ncbi:MAG: sigma-54-dependent transcriptional regulator [Negativicutes bacterium]